VTKTKTLKSTLLVNYTKTKTNIKTADYKTLVSIIHLYSYIRSITSTSRYWDKCVS